MTMVDLDHGDAYSLDQNQMNAQADTCFLSFDLVDPQDLNEKWTGNFEINQEWVIVSRL
jgi:hypothetical protein